MLALQRVSSHKNLSKKYEPSYPNIPNIPVNLDEITENVWRSFNNINILCMCSACVNMHELNSSKRLVIFIHCPQASHIKNLLVVCSEGTHVFNVLPEIFNVEHCNVAFVASLIILLRGVAILNKTFIFGIPYFLAYKTHPRIRRIQL